MERVKRCPFCGSEPVLFYRYGYWFIECRNEDCPSRVKAEMEKDKIIKEGKFYEVQFKQMRI